MVQRINIVIGISIALTAAAHLAASAGPAAAANQSETNGSLAQKKAHHNVSSAKPPAVDNHRAKTALPEVKSPVAAKAVPVRGATKTPVSGKTGLAVTAAKNPLAAKAEPAASAAMNHAGTAAGKAEPAATAAKHPLAAKAEPAKPEAKASNGGNASKIRLTTKADSDQAAMAAKTKSVGDQRRGSAAMMHSKEHSKTARAEGREPRPRAGLVPPPPPETPSMLSSPDGSGNVFMQQFVPVEFLSADSLRARAKELTTQSEAAKVQVANAEKIFNERTDRAKQFASLYAEGVISRREMETSQEDLQQVTNSVTTAKDHLKDLQLALKNVNDKLKSVAKRPPGAKSRSRTRALASSSKRAGKQAVATKPTHAAPKTALKPPKDSAASAAAGQAATPNTAAPSPVTSGPEQGSSATGAVPGPISGTGEVQSTTAPASEPPSPLYSN